MGLDGVEIILEIEETFGIELANDEAAQITTPGDIVDGVARKVLCVPSEQCDSQQLFYALRRGFRSQLKALSTSFQLDSPIAALVHKDQWPKVWDAVRSEVGDPGWPVSVPYPWLLGSGPKNVRELLWHVAASLPPPNLAEGEAWTRARIGLEVHRIIGEHMGTYDFRSRDHLVDDIGIS